MKKQSIQQLRTLADRLGRKLFGLEPGWYQGWDMAANNYRLAQRHLSEGKPKEALLRLKFLLWWEPNHAAARSLYERIIARDTLLKTLEMSEELEAGQLHEVHKAAFPLYWKEREIAEMLLASGTKAWLAQLQGAPAAMLMTRAQFEQAEILTIAVVPAWQKHGLARSLMEHAEQELRTDGVTKIFLEVSEENVAAQSLYRALGYHEIQRRKGYYRTENGAFLDALVMSKDLR